MITEADIIAEIRNAYRIEVEENVFTRKELMDKAGIGEKPLTRMLDQWISQGKVEQTRTIRTTSDGRQQTVPAFRFLTANLGGLSGA